MKKVLTVILVLAVIWAIPPARGWISTASLPVLEKLGPVGAFVLNPARRLAAKTKISFILRQIAVEYSEGHQPPEERSFGIWMKRRLPEETGIDPWGSNYWFQRGRATITVGSNGPDGQRNSFDDIKKTVPF